MVILLLEHAYTAQTTCCMLFAKQGSSWNRGVKHSRVGPPTVLLQLLSVLLPTVPSEPASGCWLVRSQQETR